MNTEMGVAEKNQWNENLTTLFISLSAFEDLKRWSDYVTTLREYQDAARETAIYHGKGTFDGVIYNTLKLAGEVGEIADKIGKILGKNSTPTPEQVLDLEKELGDVLWHLTNLGVDLGLSLGGIAAKNTAKLRSRQERGVLMSGDGDNR